ncbi:hypothetical protein DFH07DRAFT_1067193 [Mycena maculata]|uniref:Uncharacterized protein n=1 Tax=Mycena maculata TaxID=230809 RepID=A0AAD7HLW7_9AGAR|nr:hypothetical protein DFH07DRAFT_1067193 [Mycena maculata]
MATTEEDAQKQEEEKAKSRGPSLNSLIAVKRARAWQLHLWPMDKFIVRNRAKLHLPRSYLSKDGEDVQTVYPGTDLNQFVHQYYIESIDPASVPWVNFVHADDVTARRHEFLGPDPRVAGYEMDGGGNVYIRWWDGFLSDQWSGTQKWKLDVVWDEDTMAWVEKTD